MLPRAHRLKSRGHFRAVHSRGRRFAGRNIVVRGLPTGDHPSRVGFSVSERVGNAVIRNLVKRRLRWAVRMVLPRLPECWDIVVVARPSAASTEFAELCAEVAEAVVFLTNRQGKSGAAR